MAKRKIGILGGTFNPVHKGHISMAEYAIINTDLDEIWFMPNYLPPHKQLNKCEDLVEHRLNMLRSVVSEDDRFTICDVEILRGGKSYTYETLEILMAKYPDYEFTFIIGEDSMYQFQSWVHPELITRYVKILVAHREEFICENDFYSTINRLNMIYGNVFEPLEMPVVNVSSTQIRSLVNAGADISSYVTEDVAQYIKENRLYV